MPTLFTLGLTAGIAFIAHLWIRKMVEAKTIGVDSGLLSTLVLGGIVGSILLPGAAAVVAGGLALGAFLSPKLLPQTPQDPLLLEDGGDGADTAVTVAQGWGEQLRQFGRSLGLA